jgi:anti-sigma B factor antagonist
MRSRVDFEIARERRGTTVRLAVTGELDIATAPKLRELFAAERRDGAALIVLDLAEVTFMDSSGLHAVIDAHEDGAGRLRIVLGPAAARVIDLTGARDRLPIVED